MISRRIQYQFVKFQLFIHKFHYMCFTVSLNLPLQAVSHLIVYGFENARSALNGVKSVASRVTQDNCCRTVPVPRAVAVFSALTLRA